MNTEERQLSEMLHRLTPEPPRQVTVQDVAFRLAGQRGVSGPGPGRRGRARHGAPGLRRWGRGWAPALAAGSVVAVAAASAGIATALASHHGPGPAGVGGLSTISPSATSSSAAPSQVPASARPSWPPERVAGGMWDAELINRQAFAQDSLAGGKNSLYAISQGYLDRIDPATGNVLASAPANPAAAGPPVVTGNTVWVVTSYGSGGVVLRGYDGTTLAQVASVTVPVSGQVPASPQGVLTAAADGDLYLAAGDGVAVVNPGTRQVDRRISVPAGPVGSVAVSPDGNRLYVSVGSLRVLTYSPGTGAQLASSAVPDLTSTAGNLIATSGGLWGTLGVGMTERVWFAPDADLTRIVFVTQAPGAGPYTVPSSNGTGVVWIGGSQRLLCADPATGKVLASTAIPADNGVAEYFGGVALVAGGTYAQYQNQAARQAGIVRFTPPAACGGWYAYSPGPGPGPGGS
jgi:hypothetical protein